LSLLCIDIILHGIGLDQLELFLWFQGIETTEVIRAGQAIAEYTGHVMLLDEYQPDKQLNMYVCNLCVMIYR